MRLRRKRDERGVSVRGDDDGFTLVELIVAMFVIGVILASLAMVQTRAMVTIAQAKERQQASAFANATLEQLRALPWDTLKKGVSNTYPSGTDPNVSAGRLRPPAATAIDELIVVSASQATNGTAAPLAMTGGSNVQTVSDPETPGRTFTIRSYVTQGVSATGPINLTVIINWNRRGDGRTQTVIARSTAYSPSGGCGGTNNQPFLASCQAFYSAEAGVGPASVTVSGTQPVPAGQSPDPTLTGPWPILTGVDTDSVMVALGTVGGSLSSEQSTTTRALTTGSGLSASWLGTSLAEVGMVEGDLSASNDISGSYPLNPTPLSAVGSAASRNLTGTNGSLSVGVPASVGTTARAGITGGCTTPGAGVACSRGESTGSGALTASLTVGASTINLSTLNASTTSAWSGRYVATAGTSTTGCTALSGTGCAASGAQQTVGTTTVGSGVAWDGGAAPSGLVTISNYQAEVRTQYGTNQLTAAPTATRQGSISWWNGTGYTVQALSPSTNATMILGTTTYAVPGGGTVRAVGSVSVLPAQTTRTNPVAACTSKGCSLEVTMPAVTVAVTYTVTTAAGTSAFTVVTSLGAPRSASSYKAAPIV